MIPNKSIFINNFKKEINLLYANTPIGVGGWFFNFTLFRSKIGLGDQDFQGNMNWLTHPWSPLAWWVTLVISLVGTSMGTARALAPSASRNLSFLSSNLAQTFWLVTLVILASYVGQPQNTSGLVKSNITWYFPQGYSQDNRVQSREFSEAQQWLLPED